MGTDVNAEELMDLGYQAEEAGDVEKAIHYYKQAAALGNTDGFASIGLLYQFGVGVEQSPETAIEWYQKIIDAGDTDGWYLLGTVYEDMEEFDKSAECYEEQLKGEGTFKYSAYYGLAKAYKYGLGKEENFAKALDYYQQAAGNGEIQAIVELGEMYLHGDGVKEDDEIANYWFEKAGDNGRALGHLGMAYQKGWGKEIDYDKAKEYYEAAMQAGEDNVVFLYGQICYREEQYDKALEYFRRAAVEGNEFQAEAEDYIGDMYHFGEGVKQDCAKAVEWYQKAAEHGNVSAMCSLGARYYHGEGVERDVVQAVHWTLQAAQAGDVVAMCNAGMSYKDGEGVEQDYVAALAWYMRAAERGNADAMNEVGDMYYFGNGVEKDYSIAKEWFEKAIMAGNETPLMPLGTIYYYWDDFDKAMEFYLQATKDDNPYQHIAEARIGDLYWIGGGVEQDMAKAAEWYEKSAAHGYSTAMVSLGDLYRDGDGNVKQDLAKAKEWYEKAREAGDEEAEQRLAELI